VTNPWLVAAVVVVPTFMEVLDTTIAVVALRYIAGGLSATVDDGEWVITSYLAANAIILPITGWLIAHLGRRNYFLLSIAVFTLASGLCGMATSLGQLILFRVLQGLAGGGLQPSSQGVLLDAFPVERQGMAMTLFGVAALIAPVVGPTLGGWITDSYSWRWVFWINVPIGLLALGACALTLRDPDYMTEERTALRKQKFSFDGIGLSLLVIVMVCWEVMLSKGQEWDWLGDPFWRVQTLAVLFAVGLGGLIVWELRQHLAARLAAVAVRLRCAERRAGHVAGRLLCTRCNAARGARARPWLRCAMGDRRRSVGHGCWELLDVPDEPGD
jgi:DHA2 family multidrug resistance protein